MEVKCMNIEHNNIFLLYILSVCAPLIVFTADSSKIIIMRKNFKYLI